MKSKHIDIALILIIFMLILLYFTSRYFLEKQVHFIKEIEQTELYINKEMWKEAAYSSEKAHDIWELERFILIINYAEQDISSLEEYIDLFVIGTKTRDKSLALSSAQHIKGLWRNMHLFVPQP